MRRGAFVIISAAFLLLFGALMLRLYWLSVVQGEQLQARAAAQRMRELDYYQYARGDIVDRYGRALVNVEESCLLVVPAMLPQQSEVLPLLSSLLEQTEADMEWRMRQGEQSTIAPYVLKTGLTPSQKSGLQRAHLPGLLCVTLAARYSAERVAAHLIGYVQPVGEQGEYVGVSGLESQYEQLLRGRVDKQVVAVVDGKGRLSADKLLLSSAGPVRAGRISLTLDRDYQQIVEQSFAALAYSGAAVVLDPQNGDILALASAPSFDPYGWQAAEGDAYVNKALSLLHPASTFKVLLTLAALSEETALADLQAETAKNTDVTEITENTLFVCSGRYAMDGGHTVSCGKAHGAVSLEQALAVSCNCCFVALGERLGTAAVQQWSRRLGLTQLQISGLDCGSHSESEFLSWAANSEAELANACLGEQGVRLSVVQVARLLAVCANGGRLVTPRLVTQLRYANGVTQSLPSAASRPVVSADAAERLRQMLAATVSGGTAQTAAGQYLSSAGKTGSSESGVVWFSGYAPAEQPRLVIAVCVDGGTAGGVEAAAVFRRVIDAIAQLEGWS